MSFLRQIFSSAGAVDVNHPSFATGAVVARTLSGTRVSPSSAMSLSSYYGAIRAISEDIGKLPIEVRRRNANGGTEIEAGSNIARLLNVSPNPDMTAGSFREALTGNALGWGNGYAEIQRNGMGEPVALWPIHPSRVRPMRDADGVLVYRVSMTDSFGPRANVVELPAEDVFHIHGISDDGILGLSVMRYASESIGLGLAAQDFGASFFGNGASPGVVLMHPGRLKEDAAKRLRESWQAMHAGAENANKVGVLEEGIKLERYSIPPDDAQFLETRQFQVEEIARWFRIPLHKLGHLMHATFSNIEHQSLEYLQDCLMPWLVRWEREAVRRLIDPRDTSLIVRHNVNELLRGDSKSRAEYIRTMISTGTLTINEARALEDLNPVDDDIGNALFMQGAMAPVKRLVADPPAAQVAAPAVVEAPEEDTEDTDENEEKPDA